MSTSPGNRQSAQTPARPTLSVGGADANTLPDVGGTATADFAALIEAETKRCRDAARRTLGSLKNSLADLERSCDEQIARKPPETQDAAAGIVKKLVAAANAAAAAAAERGRAEVRIELEQVQATLRETRSELAKAIEQHGSVKATLQTEQAARAQAEASRAQAEAALKEAEDARQKMASTHESQMSALRSDVAAQQAEVSRLQKQIEAEQGERARLVAAIQRVVTSESAAPPPQPKAGAASSAAPKPERKAETPAPAKPAVPEREPNPELLVSVQHLFTTLEAMYAADVSAGRNSNDLVTRLTQNLRSARNVFRNQIGTTDPGDLSLFERELTELLNNRDDTDFGRHLGIAAYECSKN